MRTDPKTTIRLLAAAALCLALGSAGAQQQGQQGGFAPSPNQEPQSPEQPAPEPPRETQPVPFEAELQETLPTDRRIATAGGLIWTCEDDICRAQGQAPQGRQQTARLCGDLARRAGEIARMTVGNAVVPAPTLDRCNQAARFAGQVPEPEVPGQQEGGFVPEGADEGLPEGAQTADLDDNTLTIVGPEVEGDRAVAVEVPDGGDASVQFLLGHSDNEADTEGILLLVSPAPFEGDCAHSDFTSDGSRGFVAGVPAGSTTLDLSGAELRPGPIYYVRGCPVTGVGGRISGPPTNTVEMAVLATVAPGGIGAELPGANILTVEGEGARVELPRPPRTYIRLPRGAVPQFSYNLGHADSEHATGAIVKVSESPFVPPGCGRTYGSSVKGYFEGTSISGEPLRMLAGRDVSKTYYAVACPIDDDGGGPPFSNDEYLSPPTNVVELVFANGPDVEVVEVTPVGPSGGEGSEALYGDTYILEMTLRNNDSERAAEVLPAYFIEISGRVRPARFGAGSGSSRGVVSLEPGETKHVRVFVDLRQSSLTDSAKEYIRDRGALHVNFLISPPWASGSDPAGWEYVDADLTNNDMWLELDVRRRVEVEIRIPWVKMHGTCEVLRSDSDTRVYASIVHQGEWSWRDSARLNFNRGPLGQEKPVDYRFVLSDAEPGWEIDVSILLVRAGSGSSTAAIGYDVPWSEWRDGLEAEPRNDDSRDCPLGSIGAKVDIDTRMLPIE